MTLATLLLVMQAKMPFGSGRKSMHKNCLEQKQQKVYIALRAIGNISKETRKLFE